MKEEREGGKEQRKKEERKEGGKEGRKEGKKNCDSYVSFFLRTHATKSQQDTPIYLHRAAETTGFVRPIGYNLWDLGQLTQPL
jgi:hypothetical protein